MILTGAFLISCSTERQQPPDAPATGSRSSALVPSPGWFETAPMNQARAQHAAVLLPTGKLLVVNGTSRQGLVTTAELYDPDTNTWTAAGSPGIQGDVTMAVVLPNGNVLVLADGSTNCAVYDPLAQTWTPTGPMAEKRRLPTMTVLRNGMVLVAGGSNLDTAELYDPETNTFAPTGSLAMVHRSHTAVLLEDGRVLAVSGFNSIAGEVPSAEIYNPESGTWSLAAPPLVPRHYATATLLPDGRVLLAGGFTDAGVTRSAELYDPDHNTWTATSALLHPRNGHTATLLPNGKVLVTGGSDSGRNTQTVSELYDPSTGTWSEAGTLTPGRENATATLLPTGKILLAGGFALEPSVTYYASTALYDPGLNRWAPTSATSAREGAVSVLLPSGRVLVAGGRDVGGNLLASAQLYDRASNAWSPAANLATARERATATLLPDGRALVVGGLDGTAALATAETYDPAANAWTSAAQAATARSSHTATLLVDGRILVVGGEAGESVIGNGELYDSTANVWAPAPSLAVARADHAAVRLADGRILVAGGRNDAGEATGSTEIYDPVSNTWWPAAALELPRHGHSLTLLPSGRVLAAGGIAGSTVVGAGEIYDPAADAWQNTDKMAQPRHGHTATLMPSGKVLLAGGWSEDGAPADVAEVFDPTTGGFSRVTAPNLRGSAVAEVLPSGEVLVAGGTGPTAAELYDDTGADPAARPVVTGPDVVVRGCPAELTGSVFRGIGGGSSGSYLDSSTDFPFVRLQEAEGGLLRTLHALAMSHDRATVTIPADAQPGVYLLTVFANAIPGGRMVRIAPNTAPTAQPLTVSTPNDTAVTITLSASDPDEGQPLTYTLISAPEHGTLSGELPALIYTPNPGYVGPDSLRYRARDCGLDSDEATVSITVQDQPPTITCPAGVVVEATGPNGAVATWPEATASDTLSDPEITWSHEPGSTFPLGRTTVTAKATDSGRNESTCTLDVLVQDTTPPTVTCPADVTVATEEREGDVVEFELPAASDTASQVAVTASPASGSTFPIGATRVTVTATDAAGNAATCTFQVTVEEDRRGCGCGAAPGGEQLSSIVLVLGLAGWIGSRRRRASRL